MTVLWLIGACNPIILPDPRLFFFFFFLQVYRNELNFYENIRDKPQFPDDLFSKVGAESWSDLTGVMCCSRLFYGCSYRVHLSGDDSRDHQHDLVAHSSDHGRGDSIPFLTIIPIPRLPLSPFSPSLSATISRIALSSPHVYLPLSLSRVSPVAAR